MSKEIYQSIQDFYRVARTRDFSRDFQFRVLNIQTATSLVNPIIGPDELVYLKTGTFPGRDIVSNPTPYMGLQFNIPGAVTYPNSDNWQVEFYCDLNCRIRAAFESQTQSIFNDHDSKGTYRTPTKEQTIDLVLLNTQMETVRRCQLVGAWPKSVGELKYTVAEGKGQPISFPVTFAYQYWREMPPE
jgi:hypothetical protein